MIARADKDDWSSICEVREWARVRTHARGNESERSLSRAGSQANVFLIFPVVVFPVYRVTLKDAFRTYVREFPYSMSLVSVQFFWIPSFSLPLITLQLWAASNFTQHSVRIAPWIPDNTHVVCRVCMSCMAALGKRIEPRISNLESWISNVDSLRLTPDDTSRTVRIIIIIVLIFSRRGAKKHTQHTATHRRIVDLFLNLSLFLCFFLRFSVSLALFSKTASLFFLCSIYILLYMLSSVRFGLVLCLFVL